jgi:hypothetical protein
VKSKTLRFWIESIATAASIILIVVVPRAGWYVVTAQLALIAGLTIGHWLDYRERA